MTVQQPAPTALDDVLAAQATPVATAPVPAAALAVAVLDDRVVVEQVTHYLLTSGLPESASDLLRREFVAAWTEALTVTHPANFPDFALVCEPGRAGGIVYAVHHGTGLVFPGRAAQLPDSWLSGVRNALADGDDA